MTCKSNYRLDQPPADARPPCIGSNIHAPNLPFVSPLLALLDCESGDGHQLHVTECAEQYRTDQPSREPTQRLGIFNLKSATEFFRISSESLQSNISIQDGISVGLRQLSYLDVSGTHVSSFAECPSSSSAIPPSIAGREPRPCAQSSAYDPGRSRARASIAPPANPHRF